MRRLTVKISLKYLSPLLLSKQLINEVAVITFVIIFRIIIIIYSQLMFFLKGSELKITAIE